MIKLLALAGIAAMLAACAPVQPPAQLQSMGAGAQQQATDGAAVAASMGFHGPRRDVDRQPGD